MWTIDEIQSDDSLRRKEFPICRDQIFLAHAAVCPLPASVSKAIQNYAAACELGDQEDQAGLLAAETRALAAQFLGVGSDETALVGPTSLALSFIATGFSWRKNDHVLVYFDDYPSNVYPWMALSEWGVEVRFLNVSKLGQIRPQDILSQIDENTRMVALASCHFLSGFRIEIDAIGQQLKERGIAFCLDAIQTVGAFPTPLEHVDFMAADAHKWMLGPCAAGLMVVKKSMQDLLQPTTFGWHNVACPDFVASEKFELRNDARKYEAGSHNLMGLAGLKASLKMLQQLGVDSIANDLLEKRKYLTAGLTDKGFQVMHANVPDKNSSGIITFYREGMDMAELHQNLKEKNCQTSLRTDREGNRFIRLSPHFYNTRDELEQFLTML
ncbi:MAG: aminotransferase class V-fold PLP-dependent enzyme [Verrucomicrobia bacterium]|jgi:cysteine desulfurase / selenocysteine lyase|nr:aminotransferase class V-fold PLP-dependent enzyme [Verrucomicrobiota bacterium]